MKDLEKLDIREFAGQNVQLFVQKGLEYIAEIKLNVQSVHQTPGLASKAIRVLTKSTDTYFALKAKDALHKHNKNSGFKNGQVRPTTC